MRSLPPFARLVLLTIPFILWSLGLVALYAGHSLACEAGTPPLIARGALLAVGLIHFAAVVWLARGFRVESSDDAGAERFLRSLTLTLALAAGPALLTLLVPVLVLRLCL